MRKEHLKLIGYESNSSVSSQSGSSSSFLSLKTSNLTPVQQQILSELQQELSFSDKEKETGFVDEEVFELFEKLCQKHGVFYSNWERDAILEHLESEARPFGILQPLVDDPAISDIIVSNYSKIAIQIGRANHQTGIQFPNEQSYISFCEKLLQRAKSTISTKKPIADGMIGDYARIHMVHQSICESGPYLTIRLNRFGRVSTDDLIKYGSAPELVFEYLRAMVRSGKTVLLAGEVGTGKTTIVRALAGEIPQEESILVIEDTPEIRLEHPHVRYVQTREANTEGEGRISPSECIRAGMRMAMNRIVFGEMRDAEAAESFIDVCASGHPGLSTIHARNAQEAVSRLELFLGRAQRGAAKNVLMEQIGTAVQVIVFVDVCKHTKRRRIMEVKEINGSSDGAVRGRDLFIYNGSGDLPIWKIPNPVSIYQEDLKELGFDINLGRDGREITLPDEVLFREASAFKRH